MTLGTILIRVDASVKIGTGHVMRCLALAQAWQDAGGQAVFAMAASTAAIRVRLTGESCDIVRIDSSPAADEDVRQTIALAQEIESDWIVVDGYQFGAEYQSVLKLAGGKVLFLDDYGHTRQYAADVVLNQSVSAT